MNCEASSLGTPVSMTMSATSKSRFPEAAGAPLRTALLRPPLAVQQGQTARLVLNGPGFSVQSEGQALANASRGDRVRVKTASGEVVSGVAEDGQQVVVSF